MQLSDVEAGTLPELSPKQVRLVHDIVDELASEMGLTDEGLSAARTAVERAVRRNPRNLGRKPVRRYKKGALVSK